MILKKQDITLSYINWSEKVDNIKKISQKLSLSLDSFIFIDDNPLERDLVKKLLPQVEVLDMPTDVSFWPNYLEQLNLLSNIKITKEDSDKKNQYIQKFKFEKDLKKNKNKREFLKKININIKIEKVSKFHLSRASQMTVKTNQFNFTSKRYSVNELAKHNDKKNNMVFILKLKDNYGHHGYVSLIFISKVNKNFIIDNFLMSCRVLGRNIEKLFLRKIFKKIKNKNNHVFIEFKDSKRNKLAKNFIEENKFRSLNIKEKKNFKFKQKQNVYIVKL
jgi:FkbH-like protein